jgi:hypothetical protein
MRWIFSSEFSIEESTTGFLIFLLAGSWSLPLSISTKPPRNMRPFEQSKYLRLGLEFAESHSLGFETSLLHLS